MPMVIVSSAALTPGVDSSLLQLSCTYPAQSTARPADERESVKGHLCLQHLALTAPGSANARRGLSKAQLWTSLAKNCPRRRPLEVKACTGCECARDSNLTQPTNHWMSNNPLGSCFISRSRSLELVKPQPATSCAGIDQQILIYNQTRSRLTISKSSSHGPRVVLSRWIQEAHGTKAAIAC